MGCVSLTSPLHASSAWLRTTNYSSSLSSSSAWPRLTTNCLDAPLHARVACTHYGKAQHALWRLSALPPAPKAISVEASLDDLDDSDDDQAFNTNYGTSSTSDIIKDRTGWLALFCVGLVLAAGVVEEFDDLIAKHVELSFFVPLIMGHGGNTGSQTTCAIIRALALKQVCFKNVVLVVGKEAAAGCIMGGALGAIVFVLSVTTHAISPEVGLVVAISMPVVSLWANGLGAFLTLASAKMHMDPAMTSAPLVTTLVDTTALIIYFVIAKAIMSQDLVALLTSTSVIASL